MTPASGLVTPAQVSTALAYQSQWRCKLGEALTSMKLLSAEQVQRVIQAGDEILSKCIELGGSVTGEHGIGVEKINFMPRLFTPEDLAIMVRLRQALNPDGRCSPRKMLPTSGAGIEPSKVSRRAAL